MDFKVGDRVKGIKSYEDNIHTIGVLGTILAISDNLCHVEFDKDISGHRIIPYYKYKDIKKIYPQLRSNCWNFPICLLEECLEKINDYSVDLL